MRTPEQVDAAKRLQRIACYLLAKQWHNYTELRATMIDTLIEKISELQEEAN